MIDWINANMARHILTIEDPVEFVHESRRSLIRHREVGQHTKVFHNALRAALRPVRTPSRSSSRRRTAHPTGCRP